MRQLKVATYNIDGLPHTLDLNDLPVIFRPIAWIYRLVRGTTVITVNDNDSKAKCVQCISKFLHGSGADIIGVQEDFNYHDELMEFLSDYKCGTHTGGFDLKKLFSSVEWHSCFPFPRFKADGLNLLAKNHRVNIMCEDIVCWDKSYGYFKHANDKLIHKGFRRYSVVVDYEINIDLYIIHMDADFYHPVHCPDVTGDIRAREAQLKQLAEYIISRADSGICDPIIIMGDTNSLYKYSWDRDNIQKNLIEPLNALPLLTVSEALPEGDDVDRIFYVNNRIAEYQLTLKECCYGNNYDSEVGAVSDHHPLFAVFGIEENI